MAIYVRTNNPAHLYRSIKSAIDNGRITTWSYDSDGDFTHTPLQWTNEAWMRYVGERRGMAAFGIVPRQNIPLTKVMYAVYHGRFAEMLLTHFDEDIDALTLTPSLVRGIDVF